MALNPNHTFEDLGETKCSVVEKNCNAERVDFLKKLLETNGFKVVVVKSPPPKVAAKPAAPAETSAQPLPPQPETFTVGVTDLSFNTMNAIYNRELNTSDSKIVTPAYWKQTEAIPQEDSWYWKSK
ncbi:MAG: hypothetical protein ACLQQ4_09315 [Bacteroidia bacterium]